MSAYELLLPTVEASTIKAEDLARGEEMSAKIEKLSMELGRLSASLHIPNEVKMRLGVEESRLLIIPKEGKIADILELCEITDPADSWPIGQNLVRTRGTVEVSEPIEIQDILLGAGYRYRSPLHKLTDSSLRDRQGLLELQGHPSSYTFAVIPHDID